MKKIYLTFFIGLLMFYSSTAHENNIHSTPINWQNIHGDGWKSIPPERIQDAPAQYIDVTLLTDDQKTHLTEEQWKNGKNLERADFQNYPNAQFALQSLYPDTSLDISKGVVTFIYGPPPSIMHSAVGSEIPLFIEDYISMESREDSILLTTKENRKIVLSREGNVVLLSGTAELSNSVHDIKLNSKSFAQRITNLGDQSFQGDVSLHLNMQDEFSVQGRGSGVDTNNHHDHHTETDWNIEEGSVEHHDESNVELWEIKNGELEFHTLDEQKNHHAEHIETDAGIETNDDILVTDQHSHTHVSQFANGLVDSQNRRYSFGLKDNTLYVRAESPKPLQLKSGDEITISSKEGRNLYLEVGVQYTGNALEHMGGHDHEEDDVQHKESAEAHDKADKAPFVQGHEYLPVRLNFEGGFENRATGNSMIISGSACSQDIKCAMLFTRFKTTKNGNVLTYQVGVEGSNSFTDETGNYINTVFGVGYSFK